MATLIQQPHPIFVGLTGAPLTNGLVYIGQPGENPETHPKQVYWDQALTQPAAQPLRTQNGMIVNGGVYTTAWVSGQYSVTIRDAQSQLVMAVAESLGTASLRTSEVANIYDWDGADPTGANDNTSIFVEALAQAKGIQFDVGIWTMDNSAAFEIEDYHNIFGLGGLTAADGNLEPSGGARIRMVGSATSGFVNADDTTPLLHCSISNLAFYSTGSYTRLFDFTEMIGCQFYFLNAYTTQSTTLLRSAKISVSNTSWVNNITRTKWRIPDSATVYSMDCDFGDSEIVSNSFTGGQGIIFRGTGGNKISANRIDRALVSGAAGVTFSIESTSGAQHLLIGNQIEVNDTYDVLVDADQGVDPNIIGLTIANNTFRSSAATSVIYIKRTSGAQLNAAIQIGPNIRTVAGNNIPMVTYDPTYFINIKVDRSTSWRRDDGFVSLGRAGAAENELTIASGAITVYGSRHLVDTEGDAATDDLTDVNGLADGEVTMLSTANASRDVTVTGGGNITLDGGDMPLRLTSDFIVLIGTGSGVKEVTRSHRAAPFTPVVTFETPGDVSVVYTEQNGRYTIVGNILHWVINLAFTPTYTTASGDFIIDGLPVVPLLDEPGQIAARLSNVTWGGTDLQFGLYVTTGGDIKLWRSISAAGGGNATVSNFPSGTTFTLWLSGSYQIA